MTAGAGSEVSERDSAMAAMAVSATAVAGGWETVGREVGVTGERRVWRGGLGLGGDGDGGCGGWETVGERGREVLAQGDGDGGGGVGGRGEGGAGEGEGGDGEGAWRLREQGQMLQ